MLERLNKLKKENKKGFTLIELIVVIAILAILMALAVPAYNGLKKDSAKRVGEANARSVYTAARADEAINSTASVEKTAEMLTGTTESTGTKIFQEDDTISVTGSGAELEVTWSGKIGGYTVKAKYKDGKITESSAT